MAGPRSALLRMLGPRIATSDRQIPAPTRYPQPPRMLSPSLGPFTLGFFSVLAWSFCWRSLTGLWDGPQSFGPPFTAKYQGEWFWIVGHGTSAIVVLALGPCLLLRDYGLRRFHRPLGKVYLLSSLLAAATALPLALQAEGSPAAFLCLDALWLRAAWGLWVSARAGQINLHRRWVQVHCLLAWSAVFQRMGLALAAQLELEFAGVAGPLVWLSLLPGVFLGWKLGLWR